MKTSLFRGGALLFHGALWMLIVAMFAPPAVAAEGEKGAVGINLVENRRSGLPVISYVARKSPAAEAGAAVADKVVEVGHAATAGRSIKEIRQLIDGPAGTAVELTLRRANSADFPVTIQRRPVPAVYTAAATDGDPRAAYLLGSYYEQEADSHSDEDLPKAVEWYRKAADAGYARAQVAMGKFATFGRGMEKDFPAAADWFSKAAAQDDAKGQLHLAYCYSYGRGVPRNDREAFNWLWRSAAQDDPVAEVRLARFFEDGRGVPRDERAAFAWCYRSAELDEPYGQWGLAYYYATGRGTAQNWTEALKWYSKAEVQLPDNANLENDIDWARRSVARSRLEALAKDPAALLSIDLATLAPEIKRRIVWCFWVMAAFYALGTVVLLYASFRPGDGRAKLPVAIGWLFFFLESQGVAFFGLWLFGSGAGAGDLLGAVSALSALPVIAASCGAARLRFWSKPAGSPAALLRYGVVSLVVSVVFSAGYSEAWFLIKHVPMPGQPTALLLTHAKTASAWITFASAAVLIPVAEEIIFRGYLFDAVNRHLSNRAALAVTAVVFSAVHFQWLYFLPIAVLGLVLGWMRSKTNSLWLPVLFHVVNNSIFVAFSI